MFLNASLTGREVKEVIKNPGNIWKIEKATSDGYFIIKNNACAGKVLTAISSDRLIIEGNYHK